MSDSTKKSATELPPIAESEVSIADLANILGISLRTAQRLNQSDIIRASSVRGRSGKKYFKLNESVQAYIAKLNADAAEKNGSNTAEKLKAEKLKAEIELKTSQGELHQIKTELAKGKYISVDDVKLDYQRFFLVFKKFAMAIPSRIGGVVAGYVEPIVERGIEKDLQNEVNSMLRSFVVACTPQEEKRKK